MVAFILRHFMGMPGLSEGMFCDLSLFHWLTRFTVFCFAHIFNLILVVQKCLLQLVFSSAWIWTCAQAVSYA